MNRKFKILVVLLILVHVSCLDKLVTQFILANNYNPLGPLIPLFKHPGKVDESKCKCLPSLELVVANNKHLIFPLFLPK